jgi:hypothetical protein
MGMNKRISCGLFLQRLRNCIFGLTRWLMFQSESLILFCRLTFSANVYWCAIYAVSGAVDAS